jgi:hypothetical protein
VPVSTSLSLQALLKSAVARSGMGVPASRIRGLTPAAQALCVAGAAVRSRSVLLIVADDPDVERATRDVRFFVGAIEGMSAAAVERAVLPFPSGRVVNLHALSRDAAVSYETARRYLDVLEETLILFRIPAWSGSDRASLVAHPKLLLFDLGVRNAILRRPLDRPLDDERGLLLEHLVGLELRRREATIWPEVRVQHFRTRRGAEVDFILSVGRELWAIEVKASRHVDARDLPIAFLPLPTAHRLSDFRSASWSSFSSDFREDSIHSR